MTAYKHSRAKCRSKAHHVRTRACMCLCVCLRQPATHPNWGNACVSVWKSSCPPIGKREFLRSASTHTHTPQRRRSPQRDMGIPLPPPWVCLSLILAFSKNIQDVKEIGSFGWALLRGRGEGASCGLCRESLSPLCSSRWSWMTWRRAVEWTARRCASASTSARGRAKRSPPPWPTRPASPASRPASVRRKTSSVTFHASGRTRAWGASR